MFMFAALSITIVDWHSVLHVLKEESSLPFLFKKATLAVVNAVVVLVCFWNFVSCWQHDDIMDYVQLPIYTIGIVTQFSSGLILTGVMLHGGLKLSRRIRGANGSESGVFANNYILSMFSEMCNVCRTALSSPSVAASPPAASPVLADKVGQAVPEAPRNQSPIRHEIASSQLLANSARQSQQVRMSESDVRFSESSGSGSGSRSNLVTRASTQEFAVALNRLNTVMLICATTIFIQLTLLGLNYLLGYADESNKSVGPTFFFWIFYAWFPLWSMNICLMFLAMFKESSSSEQSSERRTPQKCKRRHLKSEASDDMTGRGSLTNQGRRWFWKMLGHSQPEENLRVSLVDSEDLSEYTIDEDDEFLESEYTEDHAEDVEAGSPEHGSQRKYGNHTILRRVQSNESAGTNDSEISGSVQSHGSSTHGSLRHDSSNKDIVFFRDVGHSKSNTTYNDYTYKG